MNAAPRNGASCGRCHRPVPAEQMESKYATLTDRLPTTAGSPLDDSARNVASATEAWRCDRCACWICNDCILPFVIRSRARRMRHRRCGGVFKAPDTPGWIGVTGQRSVPTGSWRSRFGIPAG